jgi:CSLREA domain-containing protein
MILFSTMLQSCSDPGEFLMRRRRFCEQSVYVVTKTEDTNDGFCTTRDCSLREAVITANFCSGLKTIEIPTGAYLLTLEGANENSGATGDLDISDNLRIEGVPGGAGVTIDGNEMDRVFHIRASATDVTISGVTIEGGYISTGRARGGGVLNQGSLSLAEVTIQDNLVESAPGSTFMAFGGGLYNEGTLSLVGVTISGNEVTSPNGGNGGGLYNDGDLVGSEVLIEHNIVNYFGGGFSNDADANANFGNSNFRDNEADRGGGIANQGELVLENVTITGNNAGTYGGGIHNQDNRIDGEAVDISGNHAGTDGGAIFNINPAWIELQNSALDGNSAEHFGGAIYNEGFINLTRSSITHSTSSNGASAIYQTEAIRSRVHLETVTVSGNVCTSTCPALLNVSGEMWLRNSTIAMNASTGLVSPPDPRTSVLGTILHDNLDANCPRTPPPSSGWNLDSDGTCAFDRHNDLSGVDPLLLPLTTYAGLGLVHPLDPSSPAVDTGAWGHACPSPDQRGALRPQGDHCDIGAYELQVLLEVDAPESAVSPPPSPSPPPTLPIEVNFNADAYAIFVGECTRLRWDVKNAETVLLEGQSVPHLEAEQVCPKATRSYTLVASNTSEEVERYVLIEVSEALTLPEPPAQLQISNRICTDKAYTVTLGWIDTADNEDGYRVYRDGSLIATLGTNASSHNDQPGYGGPYTYGVESFNSAGASLRPTVQEQGCIY